MKQSRFTDIVDGSKRIEYREINPYWTTRLAEVTPPFRLVLRNGMRPPVPVVTVRIDKIVPSPGGRGRNEERRGRADATDGRSTAEPSSEGLGEVRPKAGIDADAALRLARWRRALDGFGVEAKVVWRRPVLSGPSLQAWLSPEPGSRGAGVLSSCARRSKALSQVETDG